ncbi:6-phosphogluconate dehydrogenase, decarboxylating 1 [Hordeum vulgare]|nr:6-phosphogluconate dehydrogenase, decarboxylating 1 [Hordeum vulgare]
MVRDGYEYGDMQLILGSYNILKSIGMLMNAELQKVFPGRNKGYVLGFLVKITSDIVVINQSESLLFDKVLDEIDVRDGNEKRIVQKVPR